ncbi:MAG: molybdenum cofactor guanylyltransferase [Phycisphaerales bacterium]|nr:molybdenum cofactor guanylyltransferase [Phycisphaerales bacterium]
MGRPKDELTLPDGRPFVVAVRDALAPLCAEIVVLGDRDILPGTRRIADRVPGLGPLGGLDALLADARGVALVCACDQPRITTDLLARLLDPPAPVAVFATPDGRRHPLPLRVTDGPPRGSDPRAVLDAHLRSGRRALHEWLDAVGARTVSVSEDDAAALVGVNTPEDYDALVAGD